MTLRYTYDFTDEQEKIMLDSILDIKEWCDGAINGKISNCEGHGAKRIKEEKIRRGDKSMPIDEKDLMRDSFKDPDYKNRKQRDEEEMLKGDKQK